MRGTDVTVTEASYQFMTRIIAYIHSRIAVKTMTICHRRSLGLALQERQKWSMTRSRQVQVCYHCPRYSRSVGKSPVIDRRVSAGYFNMYTCQINTAE